MEFIASNTAAETIAIARASRGGSNGAAAVVCRAMMFHVASACVCAARRESALSCASAIRPTASVANASTIERVTGNRVLFMSSSSIAYCQAVSDEEHSTRKLRARISQKMNHRFSASGRFRQRCEPCNSKPLRNRAPITRWSHKFDVSGADSMHQPEVAKANMRHGFRFGFERQVHFVAGIDQAEVHLRTLQYEPI